MAMTTDGTNVLLSGTILNTINNQIQTFNFLHDADGNEIWSYLIGMGTNTRHPFSNYLSAT